jgi:methionyl-tRNA formyltransferase
MATTPPLRLVMMGTGTFAEPTLETLLTGRHPVVGLVTQPDRVAGVARGSTRQVGKGMKAIAEAAGVPVFRPESVNTPEGVARLREWNADLLVVAAYGQILANDVLSAARLGGVNVHGSLLPRHRGAAPVAKAILEGDAEAGVTIIRMTTGLDAGDMLARAAIPIGPEETAGELEARLAPLGARLVADVIERLAAGPVPGEKQDPALVTRAPKLKKEDGLIDWTQPAERVCRQVRAMQPWPTAYTFLHRAGHPPMRVVVNRTRVSPEPVPGPADAGAVVAVPGKLLVGAGGGGAVEIVTIQPAGKRPMTAAEFLNGYRPQPGDRFGPETLP